MKPFPERPKGMRHQIYERLRRQADELEAAYVAVVVGELRSFRQHRPTAETVGTGQVGDRL